MKLTTGILAVAMMAGAAWAQNTDAIDNARSVAKSLQQKQANDTNAALDAAGVPAKPAPGAPAPAVKPVVIPSSKPATTTAQAKPADKPAAAPAVKTVAAPAAKPAPAPAVVKTVSAPAPAPKTSAPAAKPQTASAKPAAKSAATAKASAPKASAPKVVAAPAAKEAPKAAAPKTVAAPASAPAAKETKAAASETGKPAEENKADASKKSDAKSEDKKWAMNGKRDPFFSPVVQQQGSSGCSTGKKCLEIGNINLRGVVKSENGFIAVVTNNLNKAYFLREQDPVFNGYVVRITGDSVVFQETVQDKLGKPFTREVVKRIFTPAV